MEADLEYYMEEQLDLIDLDESDCRPAETVVDDLASLDDWEGITERYLESPQLFTPACLKICLKRFEERNVLVLSILDIALAGFPNLLKIARPTSMDIFDRIADAMAHDIRQRLTKLFAKRAMQILEVTGHSSYLNAMSRNKMFRALIAEASPRVVEGQLLTAQQEFLLCLRNCKK